MSFIGFIPAIIAVLGGAGIATLVWRTSNKDMPSDRMDALYTRRRELLEKKRRSMNRFSSVLNEKSVEQVSAQVQKLMIPKQTARREAREKIAALVNNKKKRIAAVRKIKFHPDVKEAVEKSASSFAHGEIVRAAYIATGLPDAPFFPVKDVKIEAEGILEDHSVIKSGMQSSGFTGEFVITSKRRSRRAARSEKHKPA